MVFFAIDDEVCWRHSWLDFAMPREAHLHKNMILCLWVSVEPKKAVLRCKTFSDIALFESKKGVMRQCGAYLSCQKMCPLYSICFDDSKMNQNFQKIAILAYFGHI